MRVALDSARAERVPFRGVAFVLSVLLAGCGDVSLAPPRPLTVTPSRAAEGLQVAIEVHGESFLAAVQTDFRRRSASTLDTKVQVRLISGSGEVTPLPEVTLVDRQTVRALVPATVPRGLYDVAVVDARGQTGTLTGGFGVVTPAESVATFDFTPVGDQHPGVPFALQLSALDEAGRLVETFEGLIQLSDDTGTLTPAAAGPFFRGRLQVFGTIGTLTPATVVHARDVLGHGGDSASFAVTAGPGARLTFSAAPTEGDAGLCAGPFTLRLEDRFGFPATAAAPLEVSLGAQPDGLEFFSDAACSSAVDALTIAQDSGTAGFFAKPTRSGSITLRAAPQGLPSVDQLLVVRPKAPTRLAFTRAPNSLARGVCSSAAVLQSEDVYGNQSPPSGATPLSLTQLPLLGVELFADPACATALSVLELDGTTAETSFYLRGQAVGLVHLEVGSATLGAASLDVEVTP